MSAILRFVFESVTTVRLLLLTKDLNFYIMIEVVGSIAFAVETNVTYLNNFHVYEAAFVRIDVFFVFTSMYKILEEKWKNDTSQPSER